jgi:hypothetical protein
MLHHVRPSAQQHPGGEACARWDVYPAGVSGHCSIQDQLDVQQRPPDATRGVRKEARRVVRCAHGFTRESVDRVGTVLEGSRCTKYFGRGQDRDGRSNDNSDLESRLGSGDSCRSLWRPVKSDRDDVSPVQQNSQSTECCIVTQQWLTCFLRKTGLVSRAVPLQTPDITPHEHKLQEIEELLARQIETTQKIETLTVIQRQRAAVALKTIRGLLRRMKRIEEESL